MGILKDRQYPAISHTVICYTDQRSDGDTESRFCYAGICGSDSVTQTNDPMGILKEGHGGANGIAVGRYTDQRSDGDTERSPRLTRRQLATLVTQTNDPMGILKVLTHICKSLRENKLHRPTIRWGY